jgi:hypothetical protein
MPTIEFSTGACSGMHNYTFGPIANRGLTYVISTYISALRIMKGTIPSDFSTLTNGATSRSSDILIDFSTLGAGTSVMFSGCTNANGIFTLNTNLTVAGASGTAEWFWWVAYTSSTPTVLYNQVFGTVGTIGSGADIEIPSVSIIAGNPYRISGVKWQIPDGGFTY